MAQQVVATALYDLTQELEGRELVALSVGSNRDILTVSSASPLPRTHGVVLRQGDEFQLHIHHRTKSGVEEIALPPSPHVFHNVQVVQGDYLCVDSLCLDDGHNAHVFNRSGELLRSWHAGDAILDVQVSTDGQVWVSYFDEGIFGNNPLSRQGLNCFNTCGERSLGYADTPRGKFELSNIIDCYALNVASNRDTWLCYYTDFPLVHLVEKQIREVFAPSPEMSGMHAFAVMRSSSLFVGGYRYKNRIFWRDLNTKRQFELEVVTEEGEALEWRYARGRGADLFLTNGLKVWMLSLTDISF